MTTYVALLRGINVGGHKVIKMADLKRTCEAMGLGRAQTYIQSGNVLFQAEGAAEQLRQQMERQIEAAFGFSVPVVLRTAEELAEVLRNCPFAANALAEGESLYVALSPQAPSQAGIDRLLAYQSERDEYRIAGREIYLLYRQSMRETKLTNTFLEQRLGVPLTTRNWQTMSKLTDLARTMNAT